MPSISSSDNGYQHYAKALSDLEEDFRASKKKLEKRHQEELNSVEDQYRKEMAEQDHETEEALDRARQHASQAIIRERENSTAELQKARKEVYDRKGRFNGDDTEAFRYAKEIAEKYDTQIEKLKQSHERAERHRENVGEEMLREKEIEAADLISRANLEQHNDKKRLEKYFDGEVQRIKARAEIEKEESAQRLDKRIQEADKSRDESLKKQTLTFQETLKRQRIQDQDKIDRLQNALNYRAESPEASDITSAAEIKIRDSMHEEYAKILQQERDKNDQNLGKLREQYELDTANSTYETKKRETAIRRESLNERQEERRSLQDVIDETEEQSKRTLHQKDIDFERQIDKITRANARTLERQAKEYEEIIANQQRDAAQRLSAVQQEANFSAKMAQRAFAARQNDIIRDFDKRLADQKSEYEIKLDDMKSQLEQQQRELEHRHKELLDGQARGYEQRLAQAEVQYKERERYLKASYQDQLEKVKRTNALLIQKKS